MRFQWIRVNLACHPILVKQDHLRKEQTCSCSGTEVRAMIHVACLQCRWRFVSDCRTDYHHLLRLPFVRLLGQTCGLTHPMSPTAPSLRVGVYLYNNIAKAFISRHDVIVVSEIDSVTDIPACRPFTAVRFRALSVEIYLWLRPCFQGSLMCRCFCCMSSQYCLILHYICILLM